MNANKLIRAAVASDMACNLLSDIVDEMEKTHPGASNRAAAAALGLPANPEPGAVETALQKRLHGVTGYGRLGQRIHALERALSEIEDLAKHTKAARIEAICSRVRG